MTQLKKYHEYKSVIIIISLDLVLSHFNFLCNVLFRNQLTSEWTKCNDQRKQFLFEQTFIINEASNYHRMNQHQHQRQRQI